jgi:hypothetical protein
MLIALPRFAKRNVWTSSLVLVPSTGTLLPSKRRNFSPNLKRHKDRNLPVERNDQDDTKTAVVNMSTDIFKELRDRITRNVLLKFYNFFLVPM